MQGLKIKYASHGSRLVVCANLDPLPASEFMAEEAGTPIEKVICRRYGENKAIFVRTNATIGTEVEALVLAAVRKGGRLDV